MHRRETSVAWPGYSSAKAMALSVCALSVAWHLPRRVKHYTVTGSPEPHQNGVPVVLAVTNVLAIAAAVTEPYSAGLLRCWCRATRGLVSRWRHVHTGAKTCKSTTTQGPRERQRVAAVRGGPPALPEITDRDPLPDPRDDIGLTAYLPIPTRTPPARPAPGDPLHPERRLIGLSFPDYQRNPVRCG